MMSVLGRMLIERHTLYIQCVLIIAFCAQQSATDSSEILSFHYDTEPICDRLDVPDYPNFYIQYVDFEWQTFPCPEGAVYEPTYCECIYYPTVPPPTTITAPPTRRPTTTKTTTPLTKITTTTTTTPAPATTTTTTTRPTTTTTIKPTTIKKIVSTTPVPWIPPALRDSGVLSRKAANKQCSGCKFEGGVGYKEHKQYCSMYIMCSPGTQLGDFRADIRSCRVGEYWDQSLLTCRPSKDVYCETEVCRHQGNSVTYSHPGDCRAYWKCVNGLSVGYCCPQGEGYVEDLGCVHSPTCTSQCGSDFSSSDEVCDKISVPGNPKKFQQSVPGHGWVEMNCAAGTVFDPQTCNCDTHLSKSKAKPECGNDVDLSFSSGVADMSGLNVHARAINVTFIENSACFDGSSAIVIPRFANIEIGKDIEIRLRFKFTGNIGKSLRAILYNGDCGMQSSIAITGNADKVMFQLTNEWNETKSVEIYSSVKENQWIEGQFTLHKNIMSMTVNKKTESRLFFGRIARSRCGLKLGWGKDYESFIGCIDRMSLSLCPETKT